MRLIFGPYEPDKPEHLSKGLEVADNVYPSPDGYRPFRAFSAFTDALGESFQGGAAFVGSDGTVQLLAGTGTNLYAFDSSLAWTSLLGSLTANRWYFTQFNDHAIGTYGGTPVDIDLLNGTAAALSGSPPNADLCATVRDFVVLADGNTVSWSGFEDRTQWTAGTNQSGSQDMLSGGLVTGLTGGEYGLIFQRGQITRMSYVGVPIIWQFDRISENIGCISPGSLVSVGEMRFFLSDRGFMKTDGNGVTPIGAERIDRTFLSTYTQDDINNFMYAAADPKNHIVVWAMPGKLWIYNWILDQWSTSTQDIRAVFVGFTAGVSLDDLDAIYPNLDTMGVSLDDPRFMGGLPMFIGVNASDEIGTFEGDNLLATFDPPNLELVTGREARISSVRPITDAIDGLTLAITKKARLGDTGTQTSFHTMQPSGDVDCRVAGRYVRPKVTIDAGADWSYFQGLDLYMLSGGGRR
jgi:hypothetical protein